MRYCTFCPGSGVRSVTHAFRLPSDLISLAPAFLMAMLAALVTQSP